MVLLLTGVRSTTADQQPDEQVRLDLESVTAAHILQHLQRGTYNPVVTNWIVQATVTSQAIVTETTPTRRRVAQRQLQTATSAATWRVGFRVDLEFATPSSPATVEDATTATWIASTLDTDAKRRAYRSRLSTANDEWFGSVSNVRLESVDGNENDADKPVTPVTEPDGGASKDSGLSVLWIVLAAVGGGVLILLVCAILVSCTCRRNEEKRLEQAKTATKKKMASTAPSSHTATGGGKLPHRLSIDQSDDITKKLAFAAEINVERQDDVSTLGDPVVGNSFRISHHSALGGNDDESDDPLTAPNDDDYDYGRDSFLGKSSSRDDEEDESHRYSEVSGFSRVVEKRDGAKKSSAIYPDDASFDEHYLGSDGTDDDDDDDVEGGGGLAKRRSRSSKQPLTVRVPAGKLGMVIDTPNGSPPMVHAIKSESVLNDSGVQAGDFLVSVDQQDVKHMTAVQVSKLICQKSNQERVLVFVRKNRGRFDSADLVLEEGAC
jgi:hypothetical protein